MSSPPASRHSAEAGVVTRFPEERFSDAKLLEALVLGERSALGAVWDRYSELVENVLHRTLGPDNAKDDLVQEVFIALWRGAPKVREGAALRGYLIGVTVRQAALELRRRKVRRWVQLSPTGSLPDVPAPPPAHESSQTLRALYRVFDRLPSRQRLAFVLRHVQGCDIPETAVALEVSESTVKRELSRAWLQIRELSKQEPALEEFLQQAERGQS